MTGRRRGLNILLLLFVMFLFSTNFIGQTDTRLYIGGSEWTDVVQVTVGSELALSELDNYYDFLIAGESPLNSFDDKSILFGTNTNVFEEENNSSMDFDASEGEEIPQVINKDDEVENKDETEDEKPLIHTHVVKSGESLWDIARAYGITVNNILASNDISDSNRIRVGQELKILSVQGVLHTVGVGESLWEIAQRYKVPMDKVIEVNEINDPRTIQPRESLVIPGASQMLPRNALVLNGQLQKAFDWPLRGRISSPFGPRWGRMHNGIDIAVPEGTPIKAAADGRITHSGWSGGYGILVIIDHGDGVETRYAHNSRNVVKVGQRVERGQIIAYSGDTGNSTGPHLHFEIRYNRQPVDPRKYLRN